MSVMDESRELCGAAEELVEGLDVQPRRRLDKADGRSITAVRPMRSVLANAGFDGVPHDIQDRRHEIRVAIHLNGEGTILKQVRFAPVPAVGPARMISVQQLKSS
jgi:hypothetical protein